MNKSSTDPPLENSNEDGNRAQDAAIDSSHKSASELSQADLMSLPGARRPGELAMRERSSWSGSSIDEDAPDPLLNTTLHDTYHVTRVLGEGGMGRVYEAQHTRISTKRYAIKVLHPEYSMDAAITIRFQREAEAAATIEHDGIVGTYDVGKTPQGWPYMVCEYLAGQDLNDYLKVKRTLPAQTLVHIGKQLCAALSSAHRRGVIHRDLKPHNVFILDEGRGQTQNHDSDTPAPFPSIKILDFGLSRFVENESELTKAGIILGTPGYMAPEQAHGKDTDLRTDIYGIGALLFAMATGQPPFKADTPQLTVLAVMGGEPPRPRALSPQLPIDLEIIIQKAMARNPQERYQSAGEMEAALSELHGMTSRLDRRTLTAPSLVPPRAQLLSFLIIGSCMLLLFLGTLALGLLELRGISAGNFTPSVLEGLLLTLIFVLSLFPVLWGLRRFKQAIWSNSAKVAALIPAVRAPVLAGAASYGVSALLVRSVAAALSIWTKNHEALTLTSAASVYVVLAVNGVLGLLVALLHRWFERFNHLYLRSAARLGLVSGALTAGLLLLALPLAGPRSAPAQPERSASAFARAKPKTASKEPPPPSDRSRDKMTSKAPDALAKKEAGTRGDDRGIEPAPEEELAIAKEEGADALEILAKKHPDDSKLLKALVMAHASRADTLVRSVKTISHLLEVDPSYKEDSEVAFILRKALLSRSKAHGAAATVVTERLADEGAEFMYELMADNPKQVSRLRGIFQTLRKQKNASPRVLIAYDLRYAGSCKARLPLLSRAEKYGDKRSLQQLLGLATAPKRCGWGRTCYPPCRSEAAAFRKSARIIERRLDRAP